MLNRDRKSDTLSDAHIASECFVPAPPVAVQLKCAYPINCKPIVSLRARLVAFGEGKTTADFLSLSAVRIKVSGQLYRTRV